MRLSRATQFAILIGAIFLGRNLAADEEKTDAEAKKMHELGVDLAKQEKYEEATKAFRRAYDLRPSWKLLFNIGQCEAGSKRYGHALTAFERYLVEGGDSVPEERRTYVAKELERLRPLVGMVEVTAPEGAEVFVDNESMGVTPLDAPLRLAATTHQFLVKLNDENIYEKQLTVMGQETVQVEAAQKEEAA
jgi:tetratricopeptide (TPR) repeat protein